MTEFFYALAQHAFLQNALLAGVLSGIACGVVGSYVVVRRITSLAGGIAHCVLAGLGAARYLRVVHGWEFLEPIHGALVAALVAASIIGVVSLRARQREDTVIGALWAVGMAVGVLFIAATPGYNEDLMSYLFGNILMVSTRDLWMIALLDGLVIVIGIGLYSQLQSVCFDEEYARLRGVNVEVFYLLLLGLTALTVVLLVSIVGIILVIALLTIPVAIAEQFTRTLRKMMVLAALLSILFTTAGLVVGFAPDLPAGATTIVIAGTVYLTILAYRVAHRRIMAPGNGSRTRSPE